MMRTALLLSLLSCFLPSYASAEVKTYLIGPRGHTHGIMSFQTAENLRDTQLFVEEMGFKVQRKMTDSGLYVVEADSAQMNAMISSLEDSGIIVEENLTITIESEVEEGPEGSFSVQALNDQYVPWGILRVRAAGALDRRGEGVIVCVSDTGIDLDHPDLMANIVDNFSSHPSSANGDDANGHGTHCAGTIAAINNNIGVVGVAPKAKLIAARGFPASGSTDLASLLGTIDGCRTRGAHVISMSWGSRAPMGTLMEQALARAENDGIILVAAAGNDSSFVGWPAVYPQTIAVSATNVNDQLASFSNRGPEVNVSAPGQNVSSTYLNGQYAVLSGTSMATPHVSGLVALMLSNNPSAAKTMLRGHGIGLDPTQQGTRGFADALLSLQN